MQFTVHDMIGITPWNLEHVQYIRKNLVKYVDTPMERYQSFHIQVKTGEGTKTIDHPYPNDPRSISIRNRPKASPSSSH